MILLPKVCGPLALACAKTTETHRRRMAGVHVQEFSDDHYQLTATDGTILAILRGQVSAKPPYPKMLELANDLWDYVVPAEHWKAYFQRLSAKSHGPDPRIGLAAEKANESTQEPAHVLMTDGQVSVTLNPEPYPFPAVANVIPDKPALLAFTVDPGKLIRLLTIALRLQELSPRVDLRGNKLPPSCHVLFWGEHKPVGVCCRLGNGECFDGLIMPLTGHEPPRADASSKASEDVIDVPDDPDDDVIDVIDVIDVPQAVPEPSPEPTPEPVAVVEPAPAEPMPAEA